MPLVQVPAEFFRKEREDAYDDWQLAIFRELFTNSADAGATEVRVTIDHWENGCKITFEDNGCGMDYDVLENVYFKLGMSTKDGADTVGGFGRARILTNFSMDKYEIHTNNWFVEGSGASYEIKEVPDMYIGCKQILFTTEMTVGEATNKFRYYRSLCSDTLSIKVLLDGEEETVGEKILEYIDDLTVNHNGQPTAFGSIYRILSGGHNNFVNVQIHGVNMFTHYLGEEVSLLMTLRADISRQVLSASRDKFRGDYQHAFNAFVQKIAADVTSALKPKRTKRVIKIIGNGFYGTRRRDKEIQTGFHMENPDEYGKTKFVAIPTARSLEKGQMTAMFAQVVNSAAKSAASFNSFNSNGVITDAFSKPGYRVRVSDYIPDVFLQIDTTSVKKLNQTSFYNPEYWQAIVHRNTVDFGVHKKNFHLLMSWQYAIENCLETLQLFHSVDIYWTVGFSFRDNAEASFMRSDNRFIFFLNPLNEEGNPRFNLTERQSIQQLLSDARHEVAHVVESYHNERFAQAYGELDARMIDEKLVAGIRKIL